jgi:hypothetical protein
MVCRKIKKQNKLDLEVGQVLGRDKPTIRSLLQTNIYKMSYLISTKKSAERANSLKKVPRFKLK